MVKDDWTMKKIDFEDFDLDSLTDEEKEELWRKARKLIVQKTLQDITAYDKQAHLKLGRKVIEEMEFKSPILELDNKWIIETQYVPSGHFGKFKGVAVYVYKDDSYGIGVEGE